MMVAATSETTNQTRPPLLPSEKDNSNKSSTTRPKLRQVSSRYLSPSPSTSNSNSTSNLSSLPTPTSSRRFPSPLVSRNTTTPAAKRSVSADRRRSTRPDLSLKPNNAASGGDVSAATKILVTSTRSLSVSFQGSAFSLPISKTKETPQSPNLSSVRKGTPERKRFGTPVRGKIDYGAGDHGENTKPVDQHRWPARTRQSNQTVLSKSLSLDVGVEKSNIIGSGNVIKALHQSMNLDSRRSSIDGGRLSLDLGNCVIQQNPNGNSVNDSCMVQSDLTSDTDSVSSGSTSGVQEGFGSNRLHGGPRGMVGSAKFWQETNSRMRRLQDPGAPFSTSPGSKLVTPSKMALAKKFSSDSPLSSPRTMASPNRMRPASPSKFMTSSGVFSPSRGMVSPRRNSVSGTISTSFNETPSVLSFAVDVKRGKVGENRIVDAHLLRLFYNRQLQWRFVNAATEDTLLKQRHNSEKNLWNAWITISDLRDSVTKKRHRLQLLRQKLKLAAILKEQIAFLEEWACLDKDHSISLLGAIEALKASTLRLPVGGAIADLQSMKDVIGSAVDVMQAVCSSTCTLGVKVEEVNSKVNELANVCAKEQALLRLCNGLLSTLAALKVKDCSLRTHMLQLITPNVFN
ncbi:QWRF motif-containing protein 2-like [Rutidosis leptorrhynchoides]|uniref:QWRF motif-containing protein 2-like n=1 Tax=Rutidosis leptorrhynchoides TaxID=125765 RepID=UPI003A98F8F2